ncbi:MULTISPECIES: hypothetical protein [unclassified Lentimonas]|nr:MULTISPECIES: hypothetical protein [unclassified Lentimonas]
MTPDIDLVEGQTIWIPENVIPCMTKDQIDAFNARLPEYLGIEQ